MNFSEESSECLKNSPCDYNDDVVDLPVFRHLSEEFRAKLPPISPRKIFPKAIEENVESQNATMLEDACDQEDSGNLSLKSNDKSCEGSDGSDEVVENLSDEVEKYYEAQRGTDATQRGTDEDSAESNKKNCHTAMGKSKKIIHEDTDWEEPKMGEQFLALLKKEQVRILSLAENGDKYIQTLSKKSETTDDVMGLLRSACGKARLLVSQKMKQFEELCDKNLNNREDEKYPTTNDDLQGFWDMLYLQVDHMVSVFEEIEAIKANGWKPLENHPKVTSPTPTPVVASGRVTANTSSNKPKPPLTSSAERREMQRKKLLEIKREKRLEMTKNGSNQCFLNPDMLGDAEQKCEN